MTKYNYYKSMNIATNQENFLKRFNRMNRTILDRLLCSSLKSLTTVNKSVKQSELFKSQSLLKLRLTNDKLINKSMAIYNKHVFNYSDFPVPIAVRVLYYISQN